MGRLIIANKYEGKFNLEQYEITLFFDEPNDDFFRFYTYWFEFEYRKQFVNSVIGIFEDGETVMFYGCYPRGIPSKLADNKKTFRLGYDYYKKILNNEIKTVYE